MSSDSQSDAVRIRLTDRLLREQAIREVRRSVPSLVAGPGRDLHLDLAAVTAPTAGGLGGLVALYHDLRAVGRDLVLVGVGPVAREVFEVTGLSGLLDVRPSDCAA